ncbi:helix-turn-helix domain-containing protein [Roseomonas sp. JC162]|uniref:Helix-turn-helix domain-containing protein n=1 Tax=Neoroseomonas marina TaxID=1232220 RepID=A0A848EGC6_9PROT|nr:helix-turn-helix domain-containing protein [Neoroseomonas marina]NMJ42490.1 helix-turn-helix domain-containing protein [Neoroseomonas marina]
MLIRHESGAVPLELRGYTRLPERRMRRGEVFRSSDRGDLVALRVVEGCLRVCHPLHDGRRQITDFLMPDDGIGIDEVRRHNGSIEAVTPARVALLTADTAEAEGESELAQARIGAMQARLFMLGHKNAREKLAAFLLEMSERIAPGEASFRLPMSRYDIADYLCLSPETVCRNFTQMSSDGLISLPDSQTVQILHRAPLEFIGR